MKYYLVNFEPDREMRRQIIDVLHGSIRYTLGDDGCLSRVFIGLPDDGGDEVTLDFKSETHKQLRRLGF